MIYSFEELFFENYCKEKNIPYHSFSEELISSGKENILKYFSMESHIHTINNLVSKTIIANDKKLLNKKKAPAKNLITTKNH